jgi:hypothetical protein
MSSGLNAHEASFYSEDLHQLQPDRLTLTVPLFRDVIQINAHRVDDRTRIVVDRDETSMRVVREDERPMQVAVLGNFDDNYSKLSYNVFARPVPQVTFEAAEEGQWRVRETDIYLNDTPRGIFFIGTFADTVAGYALMKQFRERANRGELPID